MTDEQIAEIVELYDRVVDPQLDDKRVKVFDREVFGYQRVTVERPLRRRWVISDEALDSLAHAKPWTKWVTECLAKATMPQVLDAAQTPTEQATACFGALLGKDFATEAAARKAIGGLRLATSPPPAVVKELIKVSAVADPAADPITNRSGAPEADSELRDQENVPLPEGLLDLDEDARGKALEEQAEEHLEHEIKPYAADAWIDHDKTRIGFEIPFTRHFYEYVSPRPLAEIDAELMETEGKIRELLGGLV